MKNFIIIIAITFVFSNLEAKPFIKRVTDQMPQQDLILDFLLTPNIKSAEDTLTLHPTAVAPPVENAVKNVITNKDKEYKYVANNNFSYIEKTVEETIADDNKIIEAENPVDTNPLYLERTIADIIAEDNAIIESSLDQVQPLNFEIINKKKTFKSTPNKLLIGMN